MVTRGAVLSACCDQVGALHPVLGVLQGVEVAGGEGGDRLGADHHPGVLDDHEHLPDAVVLRRRAASPWPVRRARRRSARRCWRPSGPSCARRWWRRRRCARPARRSRRRSGTSARRRATGPWCPGRRRPRRRPGGPARSGRCCRSGRARREVMKRLTPSMCQEPSGCGMARVRPAPTSEPASGSVSTIVEPHCLSTKSLAHFFCSLGALDVQHVREGRAGGVHPDRGVGAEHQLGERPPERRAGRWCRRAPAGRSRRQNSESMKAW